MDAGDQQRGRTSHARTALVWLVRLTALFFAFSLIFGPILAASALLEPEWAILTTIAWLGVIVFLAHFGPYLLGRYLARALRQEVETVVESDREQAERARERSDSIDDWSDLKDTNDQ